MNNLFDIVDGKVVLNANELAIPVFKKLYDRDKTKDKVNSFNEISYIVFMYKWNSPYASYLDESTRDSIIKKDIFGDIKWEPDTLVKEAITRYKDFINTFSLQFLDTNILGARKLMDWYKMLDWNAVDKNGKPIYLSTNLSANLEKAGGILKSLEMLKEQVKREELESSKIRGGSSVNLYEDIHSMETLQQ